MTIVSGPNAGSPWRATKSATVASSIARVSALRRLVALLGRARAPPRVDGGLVVAEHGSITSDSKLQDRPYAGGANRPQGFIRIAVRLVAQELSVASRPDVSSVLREPGAASLADNAHGHRNGHSPVCARRNLMHVDCPATPGGGDIGEVLPDAVVPDVRAAANRKHGKELDLRVRYGDRGFHVAVADGVREAADGVRTTARSLLALDRRSITITTRRLVRPAASARRIAEGCDRRRALSG